MTVANQIAFALMTITSVVAAYTDFRSAKIPNALVYVSIVLGWFFWMIFGFIPEMSLMDGGKSLGISFLSFLCAFIPGVMIYFFAVGMEPGDVKLFGAFGSWLASPESVMDLAFYCLLFSFVAAIFVMIKEKRVKSTATYMLNALLLKAAKVDPELSKKEDTAYIPLAVTMFPGVIFTGTERFLSMKLPWSHYL